MALREVFAKFTTQFNGSALKRGDAQVRGLTGKLGGAMTALKGLGVAFAGLAIVGIIRRWISAVSDFVDDIRTIGDELDKTSRVIGMSSDALQKWRHAASLSGVDASTFSAGLVKIQNQMRQSLITPTSSAALAFKRLGVDLKDSNGNLRDVSSVVLDMADPINNLSSSTERTAILMALAGRSGARLGPLFDQGRVGIEAMFAEVDALGEGMSQVAIKDAADLTDAMARMDLATLSLKSKLAVVLLPAIIKAVKALTKLEAWFARNKSAVTAIKVALISLGVVATYVGLVMLTAMLPVLIPLGLIAVAVAAVILVVQDLYTWFQGGDSVLGSFIGNIHEVVAAMDAVYNAIARVLGLPKISHDIAAPPPPPPPPPGVFPGISGSAPAPEAPAPASRRFVAPRGRAQFLTQLAGAGTFTPPAPSAGARAPVNQTVQQNNTISITGAQDPEAVGRIVRRHLDRANRDAVEALGQ